MKFFLSLKVKTSQKAPKTVFGVCSMVITFLSEVMCLNFVPRAFSESNESDLCLIAGFQADAPKLLYH